MNHRIIVTQDGIKYQLIGEQANGLLHYRRLGKGRDRRQVYASRNGGKIRKVVDYG